MSNKEPLCWDKFLVEGDILFNYMTSNFTNMFDGNIIKHFYIRSGNRDISEETDKINDKYKCEIEQDLLSWIKIQYTDGLLFNKELWKPFRDEYMLTTMYYGYKKMFQYKEYYFQLAIDKICGQCEYCNKGEKRIHFELALFGWKDENNIICPDNDIIITPDNFLSGPYWEIK